MAGILSKMAQLADIEAFTIVILGAFNPQIFNPDWLARQKLIQDGEAEKATIDFLNADVAVFSLGWATVEVTRERASFVTNQAQHYELIRDLVTGVFKLLRFTPLTQFGMNWLSHFKVASEEAWHEIGDRLAPKADWKTVLERPGMLNLG